MVCIRDQISGGTAVPRGRPRSGWAYFGGRGRFQQIDEATLTQVAETTGGEYFKAEDAEALSDVLLDLPSSITLQRKKTEITVVVRARRRGAGAAGRRPVPVVEPDGRAPGRLTDRDTRRPGSVQGPGTLSRLLLSVVHFA